MLGKTRRPELRAVFDDYVKRIARSCPVEVNEVRDADAAIKRLDADRAAAALLLDAGGRSQDSEALAKWIGEQRDRGTREIIFVCGDADGFPEALRKLLQNVRPPLLETPGGLEKTIRERLATMRARSTLLRRSATSVSSATYGAALSNSTQSKVTLALPVPITSL